MCSYDGQCSSGGSEWQEKEDEKSPKQADDDEKPLSAAVYPWMTRVHSSNGMTLSPFTATALATHTKMTLSAGLFASFILSVVSCLLEEASACWCRLLPSVA